MSYIEVPTTDGLYLVDYDLIDRIVHDSNYLQRKNDTAKRITVDEGFFLPSTYHYNVDYKGARIYAESARLRFNAQATVNSFYQGYMKRSSQLPTGSRIEVLKEELFDMEKAGHNAADTLHQKLKTASRESMQNINSNVGNWGVAIEVAKFTRNASGDILLVSSAIATGGTSTLAIGAGGSLLKGAYKYQDTGNIAAGLMEASVSFVVVVIPGPKVGMSKPMARTLVFTKAKTEFAGNTAVGLVEGKSLAEASLSAGIDVALGAAAGKLKGALLPEDQMRMLMKVGLQDVSIPIGLGVMDRSLSTAQGKLNDVMTKNLMRLAKTKKNVGKPGLSNIAIASPVLVDMAILGPDRSERPRSWK